MKQDEEIKQQPTKARAYTTDEMKQRWPEARRVLMLRAGAMHEQNCEPEATMLLLAICLSDLYISLSEAVWPGKPKWVSTPEQPQRDFFEAYAEILHSAHNIVGKLSEILAENGYVDQD